ncbi:MAG TPA: aspartate/glutamate racemase family protein [Rhodanobacteraceae bacterium]|nr:aspartate/glutamate racemase family protein [Rhodanobacteraceae bacterium]
MKKTGILGGIAWPSTAEYYAGFCRLAERRHADAGRTGPAEMPEMSIESLDLARAAALLGNDDDELSWRAFDDYHRAGLQRLERAGAAFAVIACNTAHHRLKQITRDVDIPVISILDVAADACLRLGVGRLLILGTETVMTSNLFRNTFRQRGIDAFGPSYPHHVRSILSTIEALEHCRIDGAADRIREVVAGMPENGNPGSTAVYLGCTELPLAFEANRTEEVFERDGVRYINSTALHIRAAFDCAMEDP